ncbi:MAG: glutathione S-transferase [Pseudomonadota bacterium]
MLTVHHLENSRSQRVLWLLEELGAPYEVRRYERDKKTSLAPAALTAVHPLGKSPVIEHDGFTIAETGAIVEYIIDVFDGDGRFRPEPRTPEMLTYRFWLHYAEGSAFPPLLLKLITTRMATAPMPFFIKPIAKQLAKGVDDAFVDRQLELHGGFIEDALSKDEWFAGDDISGADIMMSFPIEAFMARARGGRSGAFPSMAAYLDRIHERPAYQAALDKGGPYALLGAKK